MRKKLKIDQLAKLRQFTPGMDVEKFLSSEFRQIVRALEQSGIDLSDYPTLEDLSSSISNAVSGISSSADLGRADLYATEVGSFGIGTRSLANRVLKSGAVTSNVFYPATSGTYWIDFGMSLVPLTAGATNYLYLKQSTTATHTLRADLATIGKVYYATGRALLTVTNGTGAWFDFQGTSDTVGFNFYCSFTKVS